MGNGLLIYLAVINLAAFLLYGIDKLKAQRGAWRISEATLLLSALVGGSVGALLGMKLFRHKTLHPKFTIGVPAILILQIALVGMLIFRGLLPL
ncbi:MAG: DUF1294 domain-containing protein [Oscillospiraceae bacterium]|nr:DUF1294 domain-containing protein [Oscillospiraceae bacterium]